jgi:hypothetical protein
MSIDDLKKKLTNIKGKVNGKMVLVEINSDY